MSGRSNIEWTAGDDGTPGRTWNPTRGCSMAKGSELGGCKFCYAARQALRHAGPGGAYEGLVRMTAKGPRWTGKIALVEESLEAPLHVKEPCRWFVDSMSDLFHEEIPDHYIDQVFATMGLAHWHTFQVLTKRADRMAEWSERTHMLLRLSGLARNVLTWPLPNVWLGVSVENEDTARPRIEALLRARAAVRFVSYEPALGPVDFEPYLYPKELGGFSETSWLDWVIVGGESGPGARPFDLAWARHTIAQCEAAGVPCFVKQLGACPLSADSNESRALWGNGADGRALWRVALKDRKGGDMSEWPEDLRVREFPK